MKKTYSIVGLIGAVIWSITIFLRETNLVNYNIVNRILGVAPNFGAVFLAIGLIISFYPYVFKKESDIKNVSSLVIVIFILLLISEIIHHFFLNSNFDIWDMVSSLIASIIVLLIHTFNK